MKRKLPVYKIDHFKHGSHELDVYVNDLNTHIREHDFTKEAHKHDFYLSVLVTRGSGKHEIDFRSYDIRPGCVFVMLPGQTHKWKASKDIEGFVFFHSENFFDQASVNTNVRRYPFFDRLYNFPLIVLKDEKLKELQLRFEDLLKEFKTEKPMRIQKLQALITLIYIELSRSYKPAKPLKNEHYLEQVNKFIDLIDKHYKHRKFPFEYAQLMNLSEKHLNRVSKESLNKTSSDLIAERIILEAKRMLIYTENSVNEIAYELGFEDNSYFGRFFKKQVGLTPKAFAEKFK
jgi:AraC family transcriptional activator of pobA